MIKCYWTIMDDWNTDWAYNVYWKFRSDSGLRSADNKQRRMALFIFFFCGAIHFFSLSDIEQSRQLAGPCMSHGKCLSLFIVEQHSDIWQCTTHLFLSGCQIAATFCLMKRSALFNAPAQRAWTRCWSGFSPRGKQLNGTPALSCNNFNKKKKVNRERLEVPSQSGPCLTGNIGKFVSQLGSWEEDTDPATSV